MFKFLSKKRPNTVQQLSEEEKVLIEEYLEDDIKASEISEKTGIELVIVKRYVDLLRKRAERRRASGDYVNSEISELKEQLKIEDLKHQLSAKKERQALEMEKLRLDIEERKAELYDDGFEDDDGEPDILGFLTTLLNKNQNSTGGEPRLNNSVVQGAPAQPPHIEEKELSNEEIKQLIQDIEKNNPQYLVLARTMPESQVIAYLKQNYALSDDTIKRALEMVKNDKIKH